MASLAGLLERSARLYGARSALLWADDKTSYEELWAKAQSAAAWLSTKVSPGDRVLLHLPNGEEFVVAYYAALIVGAIVVPLPFAATDVECAAVIGDCGARIALTPGVLQHGATTMNAVALLDNDPAAIVYTSGTSGDPKGVVLTHANLLSNATVASRDVAQFTSDDVMLVTVQFAHAFGMTSVLNACLYAGASLVIPARWDAVAALALMRRHAVTVVRGVPTTYIDLLDALPSDAPAPTLRAAFSGGSAMAATLLERVEKAFDTTVWEGYGLTEASPLVACNQRAFGRRAGTVGHAVPDVEVRVTDADASGVGQVIVRGPNVMAGYWNRPAETAAVLVDGWLHTGDLGAFDADGFLRIVDRAKDVIKRGGAAVYPREVEDRLVAHPAVRAAAVVGIPDPRLGERVAAAVVTTSAVTPDELIDWCRRALSSYKCPEALLFVDALPLGPTGKVLKSDVRAWWSENGPTTRGRTEPS